MELERWKATSFMPQFCVFLFIYMAALELADGTLSSADRKPKEKFKAPRNLSAFNKGYIKLSEYEKIQLLYTKEQQKLSGEERKYPYPCIAYVTPWKKVGYEIARQAAKKFDILAPVWFNVYPKVVNTQRSCFIDGAFNINRDWIEAVRSNNSKILVTPRFFFTEFSKDDFTKFVLSEMWQRNCINQILNIVLRNQLNGAVFEIWSEVMDQLDLQYRSEMLEFVASTGNLFHAQSLKLIIPVHAELDEKSVSLGVTLPEDVSRLAESVDFIQVKTYSFKTPVLRGVSPLYWMRENMRYMIQASPEASNKLLMGINFFGYRVKARDVSTADSAQFTDLLEEPDSEVYWDSVTEEIVAHSLKRKEMIYFPTTESLTRRLELAKKFKVGIAIWELGQGFNYFTQLL